MRKETVVIIHQSPRVLLGMKKIKFGAGKYNGFGGGVKKGETLEKAVKREAFEEAGIILLNPEKYGEILFQFDSDEQDHLVNFFKATEFSGEPKESREMIPRWFNEKRIPYDKMWEDDKYWLPLLLEGKKFVGEFYFDKDFKLYSYKLIEKIKE